MAFLFILSGCGEDKMLFTDKEMECMDVSSALPQIQMTGDPTLGNEIELKAILGNIPANSKFYWEGPAGVLGSGPKIKLVNIDSTDAGNYTLYAVRGDCTSKKSTVNLQIKKIQVNCTPNPNWIDVAGLTGFEKMQYDHTFHNESGGYYFISPYTSNTAYPNISIAINQNKLTEGEYIITSQTQVFNLPSTGKYALLRIGYLPNHLANYTAAKLQIVKNSKGEFEVTACNVPVKKSSGSATNLMTMKFVCD